MSALPAFDTYAYVKRLKAAGFNEAQAEAQADLQSEVLSSLITDKLATKEDLAHLEARMATKADLAIVKADVAGLKTDVAGLKTDVAGLKKETTSIREDLLRLAGKMGTMQWMLGFLLAGVFAIMMKLFLHT